jgi:ankyrin repeat protein
MFRLGFDLLNGSYVFNLTNEDLSWAKDDSGWTPLMIAASVKDSEETLSLLLAKGADVNQKSKSPGRKDEFYRPGLMLTGFYCFQTTVVRQVEAGSENCLAETPALISVIDSPALRSVQKQP